MPYGVPLYDKDNDMFTCEFPIQETNGTYHICNQVFQDLVRHITKHHRITANEYKKMLGFNKSEKLMSRRTQERYRKNKNVQKGWSNLEPIPFKKGENEVQNYLRSPQNRRRLRRLHLYRKKSKANTQNANKNPIN